MLRPSLFCSRRFTQSVRTARITPVLVHPTLSSCYSHRRISCSIVVREEDNVYQQLADILKNVNTPKKDAPAAAEEADLASGNVREQERHAKDVIDNTIMGFGRTVHSEQTSNDYTPPGDMPSPLHSGQREILTRWMPKDRYRTCLFCRPAESRPLLDPMNVHLLLSFMNYEGCIMPRRATGCCAKHQRKLSRVIKRAKHMGIFSYKKGGFTVFSPYSNPKKLDELASVSPRDLIMYEIRKMEEESEL